MLAALECPDGSVILIVRAGNCENKRPLEAIPGDLRKRRKHGERADGSWGRGVPWWKRWNGNTRIRQKPAYTQCRQRHGEAKKRLR